MTALTHSEAVKTGVTVSTQLAGELPRIQCDRVQLQQVMLNLIVNAIQSMSGVEDGNAKYKSAPSVSSRRACAAVRDTGHGLRPEGLPRLFEPFYTRKPDGMGMGLSTAARLSKPMVGGCGRPGASRRVLSFSSRSPLTEPPSVIDVAYWHIATNPKAQNFRSVLAVGSIGQCNTARSLSAGVSKAKVFRGR